MDLAAAQSRHQMHPTARAESPRKVSPSAQQVAAQRPELILTARARCPFYTPARSAPGVLESSALIKPVDLAG